MNEFDIIKRFFSRHVRLPNGYLGVGDDCALVSHGNDQQLAMSIDTMVQGVHFPAWAPADLIGERLLRVALSDLAAMGAEPKWFTLALTLPEKNINWLSQFSHGLYRVADKYNCKLVGGDTTRGPLTLSAQVHGELPKEQGLLRSNAQPGDLICVTNTIGNGAAGLAFILAEKESTVEENTWLLTLDNTEIEQLRAAYYQPKPQINAGLVARKLATSAIDISDGLIADLAHICRASDVVAQIDLDTLPIANHLQKMANRETSLSWALYGGDDYQLCLTVSPERFVDLQKALEQHEVSVTQIGKICHAISSAGLTVDKMVTQKSFVYSSDGEALDVLNTGYQHFV